VRRAVALIGGLDHTSARFRAHQARGEQIKGSDPSPAAIERLRAMAGPDVALLDPE